MRHAVVVAPLPLPPPHGANAPAATHEPVGSLCAALERGDYRLTAIETGHTLDDDFGRALGEVAQGDALLVALAATSTLTPSGEAALRLGADQEGPTLALRAMSDRVLARAPARVLWIIDTCHDGDPEDPFLAASHVETIVASLDARSRGFGVLLGVHAHDARALRPWPFLHGVVTALDDPASVPGATSALPASLVYERLCTGNWLDGRVQSYTFVRGRDDFSLVPGPPSSNRIHGPRTPRPPGLSLPAIGPLLTLADSARARGALEDALAGYKAALMVVGGGDDRLRGSIYARMADVKRAQSKPREAELNFEKALAIDPHCREALDALVEIETDAGDLPRALEWRRKRLSALERADERVAELLSIARIQRDEVKDLRAAAEALEEAHALDPRNRSVVEDLRAACETLHRWPRVVQALDELADVTEDATQRATLRFDAAGVALTRLHDEERGAALLDRVLADDPTYERALQALVSVLTSRSDWAGIDACYARLVDRFARMNDVERAWETCRKLGALRRDRTRDLAGAIEAFTGAVRCKPGDVDSRTMLADAYLALGDVAQAVAEFERIAQVAPTRASTYARLFLLYRRYGQTDRAWLSGVALEELGAADVDQQLVVDQYRPQGPIRPSRALTNRAWDDLLRAPGADDVVSEVFESVLDAAVAARTQELREGPAPLPLDPAFRQGPGSTVSAVRSFRWAAQVLGIAAPDLYVLPHLPGGVVEVPVPVPTLAFGPDVLHGVGAKDLAFLAGRHLTSYRPEHYALVHYPRLDELSCLFLASIQLVRPRLPVPPHQLEQVGRYSRALGRRLGEAGRQRLEGAVARLEERGGRLDLAAWMRSVALTAHRAGLLLCGDLAVALARLRAQEAAAVQPNADPTTALSFEEKRGDLLAFCASEKLASAREALAVSIPPPPPAPQTMTLEAPPNG